MKDLLARRTRALLVQPGFSKRSFWNYSVTCRVTGARYPAAPLGLMTVAALLPQGWDIRLVDENVRRLTAGDLEWADIVLVGSMLPQQVAARALIERVHAAGKPVVLGGPDPSEQPELYDRADYLVLGEGEVTVPMFLADLDRHASSGSYRSPDKADMTRAVVPRFDLIRFRDYIQVGIQFSRGCPFNCEFCDIIELFGRRPRTKTPQQVLAELQALYDLGHRGHVDFVDDNLIGNKSRALEALAAIADWSRRHNYPFYFSTEASINLAREPELLGLMRECDFRYLFVGIESPEDAVLARACKTQNRAVPVPSAVRTLAEHGLIVNGGFILGMDDESPGIARNLARLIEEAGICLAMVGTLYALPRTRLARRLQEEGRLFHNGHKTVNSAAAIDQTTTGLNFVTQRPRVDVIQDQAAVLRHIYDPARYYEKVRKTATRLRPGYKHRVGFGETLKLARALVRVSVKAGFSRRSGLLYWKTLLRVLLKNPAALDVVVNLAAMYLHFDGQSRYAAGGFEKAAERVGALGEDRYNAMMLAAAVPRRAPGNLPGESRPAANRRCPEM
ncbi:B12-binding domain-containing radical SAM protein, partial [candidate division WOR-3 bacterium]|nr:B12-binding domain-containing radical SAM protein [candidate division WOR-3 bacterium]